MVQGDAMPAKSYVWIFLALLAGILIGRISVKDAGETADETERSSGYSGYTRLGNDSFPPDSQSIPAQEAFKAVDHPNAKLRSRDWSHLLLGKNLVPVDGPPTTGG
jgi:hypothetical protein